MASSQSSRGEEVVELSATALCSSVTSSQELRSKATGSRMIEPSFFLCFLVMLTPERER